MKYALKLSYIGKEYHGSQIQFKNGKEIDKPTIQGIVEKAICTVTGDKITEQNRRPIRTVFSGRTDRGVNAKGQVLHFRTDKDIVASKFIYSVNEILPPDISIRDLEAVSEDLHAQKSAKLRYYRYEFINRRNKDAFDGNLLRVKYPINIARMEESLSYIVGEHDFSSFKSAGTLNPSTVCTIEQASCKLLTDDRVVIDIVGNRFLYNMVRTIVGTLLEIEGHDLSPKHMKNVLEAEDRRKAGQTISPYGLTLVKVQY